MTTDTRSPSAQPAARTIAHKQRDSSDDVNPLLQSSPYPIVSDDDNYVVGRQRGGQLHSIVPGFKLSLKDKLLNPIEKYYEVDRRSYPFVIRFDETPSAQATFKFIVTLEFNLKVLDPCAIVSENHTSMLHCIRLDLKRCVHDVTSRFLVQNTDDARLALHAALNSFGPPAFLQMVLGVVDVMPDQRAAQMLSELHAKDLKVALIGTQTELNTATGIGDKIAASAAQAVEEHQLAKQVPGLVDKLLKG
jgi:hypothetical protein